MEKKAEFSDKDLRIAELPQREAMSLVNVNGNSIKNVLNHFIRIHKH